MLTEATKKPHHQRVLVAEDHPGMSAAIRRLLVADDFEVAGSVEDGAQVLEEAARLQPDIVLLDLNMPNMNGIDACRELTCMFPRTRTIVVTAEDPVYVRPGALAAGAFAFVEKRAMHTDLLPAVRLACRELAA
jgi:DNA-binding NarL/FixJ family response regulator